MARIVVCDADNPNGAIYYNCVAAASNAFCPIYIILDDMDKPKWLITEITDNRSGDLKRLFDMAEFINSTA